MPAALCTFLLWLLFGNPHERLMCHVRQEEAYRRLLCHWVVPNVQQHPSVSPFKGLMTPVSMVQPPLTFRAVVMLITAERVLVVDQQSMP